MNFKLESDALDAIIPALCKAKLEFPAIEKGVKGARSKYAAIEDFLNAINPRLGKYGLFLSQAEQMFSVDQGVQGPTFLVTTIYHASGQFIRSIAPLVPPQDLSSKGTDNIFQLYGGQLTYRKRYMIASILGIAAENEDDDGESLQGAYNKPSFLQQRAVALPTRDAITKEQVELLEAEVKDLPELKDRFLKSRNITNFSQLQADRFSSELRAIQERAKVERDSKLAL